MRQLVKAYSRTIPGGRQHGVVLFVVLIMLLLLTIIGVTAVNNVTMEERMAGNLRDGDLAFQAAEAALRNGENWLSPLSTLPAACTTAPCTTVWDESILINLADQDTAWWTTNGRPGAGDIANLYANPVFIVEELAIVPDSLRIGSGNKTYSDYYKVTAHATGGSQSAISVLQTTFVKRYN